MRDEFLPCAHQRSLIKLYDRFVREYTQAVVKLSGISGKIARDDWHLAWELAERAREKSAETLSQLRQHKQEHGC